MSRTTLLSTAGLLALVFTSTAGAADYWHPAHHDTRFLGSSNRGDFSRGVLYGEQRYRQTPSCGTTTGYAPYSGYGTTYGYGTSYGAYNPRPLPAWRTPASSTWSSGLWPSSVYGSSLYPSAGYNCR